MNKIALVIATYEANINMLHQALKCSDLFDEVVLHVNDPVTASRAIIPRNCKVIYEIKRCSVQEALNIAISQTTSNYILPFTDDDFFDREVLNNVLSDLRTRDGNDDVIYYPIYTGSEKEWKFWAEPFVTYEKLLENNLIPFSSIYNKEVWRKVRGYKSGEFSDWFFWLEVLKAGYKLRYLSTPVYYHRHGHKETLANKEAKTFNKEEFLNKLK